MRGSITYQHMEGAKKVPNGIYTVTLGKPFASTVAGLDIVKFPITFSDDITEGQKVYPDSFDLFDVPLNPSPKDISSFNLAASRIVDCFQCPGNFDDAHLAQFTGQKGIIEVGENQRGYKTVTRLLPAQPIMF